RRALAVCPRMLCFFSDRATPVLYPLSLHDALPIYAFDIRYGTLLAMDLAQRHAVDGRWSADPWDLVAQALTKPNDVLSPAVASRDRKSTRLNSSHVKISYAVFCLKKKNNTNDTDVV